MKTDLQTQHTDLLLLDASRADISPAVAYLSGLAASSRVVIASRLATMVHHLNQTHDWVNFPWHTIQRHHVQALLQLLHKDNKQPATINSYLSALKGVLREAWIMKRIDSDTWTSIKEIRSFKGSRLASGRALAQNEIKQLLESDGSLKGIRDRAIFALLVGAGLRRTEVVNIMVDDVDLEGKSIKVVTKGNQQQQKFLPTFAHTYLSDWMHIRGSQTGALFYRLHKPKKSGEQLIGSERMTAQAVYYILTETAKKLGLEQLAPHDLRRTFATALLDAGEDLVTVRDAMGHASVLTTQRYDKRGQEKVRKAASTMDGWLVDESDGE
jgi:site-specific recombinase XerD